VVNLTQYPYCKIFALQLGSPYLHVNIEQESIFIIRMLTWIIKMFHDLNLFSD